MRGLAAAAAGLLIFDFASADEKPVQLKRGLGLERVEAHCGACHSLDYIAMNSPFLSADAWEAGVAKMTNAFGAPIDRPDAKIIADYLKNNYGDNRGVSGPRPAVARQRSKARRLHDVGAWRYYSEPYSAGQ